MDPLTIITSIPTLLDICTRCINILKTMKSASKDCPLLLYEITNLETLLQRLELVYSNQSQSQPQSHNIHHTQDHEKPASPDFPIQGLENHILRMRTRMEEVEKKLVVRGERRFGALERAVKWPWSEKEVKTLLGELERDKLLLNLWVQGDHFALSQALKLDVKDIRSLVVEIGEGVRAIQSDVGDMHERATNEEFHKMLTWISPIPFWNKQRDLQRKYLPGSGSWFLSSLDFQRWINGDVKVLNCTGIPGSGKTILSSIVVDHLEEHRNHVPRAYVFCDYLSRADRAVENILPSILRQVVQMRGDCSADLKELFKTRSMMDEPLSLKETGMFIEEFLGEEDRCFVVVDGLDELDDEDDLLEWILRLSSLRKISLMTTSRRKSKILERDESVAHVEIRPNDEDVKEYVRDMMPEIATGRLELQQTIVDSVCDATQGMFIIATLHMETLSELGTEGDIRRALKDFSIDGQSLDSLYLKVMDRIAEQSKIKSTVAHRLLGWLTKIRRPLSPDELRHAFAIREGDQEFQTDMLYGMDYLLGTCKGLVEVDKESNVVRLVHKSAWEFLESHEMTANAEEDITGTCLTYLSLKALLQPVADREALQEIIDRYPFFQYAAISWGYHAKAIPSVSLKVENKVHAFLRLPCRASDILLEYWVSNEATQRSLEIWKGERRASGLHRIAHHRVKCHLLDIHIATVFRFIAIIKSLMSNDPDRYWKMKNSNPLCWAARLDRFDEMKLMIEHGADVNAEGGVGWTPLHWACICSSLETVRLLLESGADITRYTAEPSGGETPLHKAVFHDRADVVEELLKRGADITAGVHGKHNSTSLSYALDKGRPKCLELLVFKHKALTPENTAGLMIPIEDPALLRRLLETGINPNQNFGLGLTMLDTAIRQGDGELIGLCLEHGALPRAYWTIGMPQVAQHSKESWFVKLHALIAGHVPPVVSASRSEYLIIDRESRGKELFLEALLPSEIPQPNKIIFTITSQDQGWSSFPHDHGAYMGSQSFFAAEICSVDETGETEVVSKRKRIVYNVHASKEWKQHVVVWEKEGARKDLKKWFDGLRPGYVVRVYARAPDWGWENHVQQVKVDIFAYEIGEGE